MVRATLGRQTTAGDRPSARTYSSSHPHGCLTPLVAGCRSVGSLFQPGPHRAFLMPPTPRSAAQKAAQTGQARLQPGLRPGALHLLPQGVQPQPAQQPTAHHPGLGRGGGAQQGAEPGRRVFMQRPGNQQRPHRRFHTDAVRTAYLVEPQQLLHFFKHQFHLPPRTIHIEHIGRRPGRGRPAW